MRSSSRLHGEGVDASLPKMAAWESGGLLPRGAFQCQSSPFPGRPFGIARVSVNRVGFLKPRAGPRPGPAGFSPGDGDSAAHCSSELDRAHAKASPPPSEVSEREEWLSPRIRAECPRPPLASPPVAARRDSPPPAPGHTGFPQTPASFSLWLPTRLPSHTGLSPCPHCPAPLAGILADI